MRNLLERRDHFQPKVARWWPSAKAISRMMEIAKKFGLEFLSPPGA
jgi:hypothetical protein